MDERTFFELLLSRDSYVTELLAIWLTLILVTIISLLGRITLFPILKKRSAHDDYSLIKCLLVSDKYNGDLWNSVFGFLILLNVVALITWLVNAMILLLK